MQNTYQHSIHLLDSPFEHCKVILHINTSEWGKIAGTQGMIGAKISSRGVSVQEVGPEDKLEGQDRDVIDKGQHKTVRNGKKVRIL